MFTDHSTQVSVRLLLSVSHVGLTEMETIVEIARIVSDVNTYNAGKWVRIINDFIWDLFNIQIQSRFLEIRVTLLQIKYLMAKVFKSWIKSNSDLVVPITVASVSFAGAPKTLTDKLQRVTNAAHAEHNTGWAKKSEPQMLYT